MADQGKWAKLWISCLRDPKLDILSLEDFARWVKMLILTKEQGTSGELTIYPPAPSICTMLQVKNCNELLTTLMRFPHTNVVTTEHRYIILTFHNWHKFQVDNSSDRVTKFRHRVTTKKRREEKRVKIEKIELEIPKPLDTETFRKAWLEWEQYRREINKTLKPTSIKKQLKELVTMGHQRAIKAIEFSIARGYQGIFEPSNNQQKSYKSQADLKAGGTGQVVL